MAQPTRKRGLGQITRLPSGRYRARYTGPDMALHNAHLVPNHKASASGVLFGAPRLSPAQAGRRFTLWPPCVAVEHSRKHCSYGGCES
jgi:hypothetical protein